MEIFYSLCFTEGHSSCPRALFEPFRGSLDRGRGELAAYTFYYTIGKGLWLGPAELGRLGLGPV